MTTLDPTAIKAAHDAALPVIELGAAPFHVIDVAVAAYLDALSSLPAQAVGVKALEWRDLPAPTSDVCEAQTPFGAYRVWGQNPFWYFDNEGRGTSRFRPSQEAAKAAAQADYDARIRSALVAPSQPAAVGAIEAAARDLVASRSESYRAGNNRQVSLQDQDGEKMWIVPFDEMAALEAALRSTP